MDIYRCRACKQVWTAEQVRLDPRFTAIVYSCWDMFCGGTCDRVETDKEAVEVRPKK